MTRAAPSNLKTTFRDNMERNLVLFAISEYLTCFTSTRPGIYRDAVICRKLIEFSVREGLLSPFLPLRLMTLDEAI